MIKIIKKDYSWGTLRTIENGNSYIIVIDPENWEAIQTLICGKEEVVVFKDEQGIVWSVTHGSEELKFRSSGNKNVSVKVKDLE